MYLTWGNDLKEPFIYEEITASTLAPRAYLGSSMEGSDESII